MIKVNGQEVSITKFPNGESCVNTELLNSLDNDVTIHFKWFNDEDILHLYFVLFHLVQHGITKRTIYIYYMPYSRMDRDQNGNCFTLKHVCNLLNQAITNEDEIYVCEPHSDVTLYSLGKAHRLNVITPIMNKVLEEQSVDVLCYPDKGARDRFSNDSVKLPIAYCNKRRDFNTGEILGLDLVADVDLQGKNVLILDDLCSKGGTFYFTAKRLKEAGVNNIYLGLCHMEGTAQYGKILNFGEPTVIDHIYCTDSMIYDTNAVISAKNITVYSMEQFLTDEQLVPVKFNKEQY